MKNIVAVAPLCVARVLNSLFESIPFIDEKGLHCRMMNVSDYYLAPGIIWGPILIALIPTILIIMFVAIILMRAKSKSRRNQIDIPANNISGNIIFYFDGHIFSRQVGFCNVRIDNQEPIQAFSGMPIGLNLEPGIHTVLVTYPRQGNEVYPANTQINVEPNTKYQVIYTFPATQFTPSKISVRIMQ